MTIDTAGNIIVASRGFNGTSNGIIKVNPLSGGQTVITSGPPLVQPNGVAIDASGNIIVADGDAFGGPGGVIRVDPANGTQTAISSGGFFVDPQCVAVVPPLQVSIDIKPGSDPNSINLGSGGTVPVAILSTPAPNFFDATTVDPLSVTLAGASVKLKGKGTPMASAQDVNDDGLLDLVVHVSTEASELSDGDIQAILTGQTFSGQAIQGSDSVRIVP